MDNKTGSVKSRIVTFLRQQRDLIILAMAFIFSLLGFLGYRGFVGPGFMCCALGPMNALLPSKNDKQDERTIYIKYITGFYVFAIWAVVVFASLLVAKVMPTHRLGITLSLERLLFIFLHVTLFTYTALYSIFRRLH